MFSMELLLAFAFVTGILLFLGGYSLVNDLLSDRTRARARVSQACGLGLTGDGAGEKNKLFRDLSQVAPDVLAGDMPKQGWVHRMEAMLEQSGLYVSFQQLVMFGVICSAVCGTAVGMLYGNLLIGMAAALAGFYLPVAYVRSRWAAKMYKLRQQLPDAFELMARVVRAGQTMPQAILAVSQEFEPPLAAEFSMCYEQQNLGLSFEATMRKLADRTGLLEIKILVMALLVQQETGGNLAQVLDNLADVVRNRLQVRDKVKVLTAEGRMQAIVLLSLPFAALAIMYAFNREYAMILLNSPKLLSGMVVSMCLGALWIRKIINIDF